MKKNKLILVISIFASLVIASSFTVFSINFFLKKREIPIAKKSLRFSILTRNKKSYLFIDSLQLINAIGNVQFLCYNVKSGSIKLHFYRIYGFPWKIHDSLQGLYPILIPEDKFLSEKTKIITSDKYGKIYALCEVAKSNGILRLCKSTLEVEK